MMLDFLGNGDERFQQAHNGILAAIEEVIAHGQTPDMKRQCHHATGCRRDLQNYFALRSNQFI